MTKTKLDNTAVSYFPRETLRTYVYILIIYIGLVSILGIFLLISLGATIEFALVLTFGTTTTFAMSIIMLSRSMDVIPEYIILNHEKFLLGWNSKEISFSYRRIISFVPYVYEREKVGDPDARWIVTLKKGIFFKKIHLTEKNVKTLAKELDERRIPYWWDVPGKMSPPT